MKRTSEQSDIAIELKNVSKKYAIHHEKPTLVERFIKKQNETFWALKNIDISIQRGERIGIIGPNGSGKTTILKIIAGITTPTGGTVVTHGKVVSLIDLNAGFHSDLSGIQNIYLNGMLLGLSKHYINSQLRSIIDFADIRQFIDVPLYTYSAGMALRLGYSIAVHANPDILLMDEHFSTGDSNFQKKSNDKMKEFLKKKTTIILVTHQLQHVADTCSRVIWLNKGNLKTDGGLKTLSAYDPQWNKRPSGIRNR